MRPAVGFDVLSRNLHFARPAGAVTMRAMQPVDSAPKQRMTPTWSGERGERARLSAGAVRDARSSSTFWTREDGQLCLQSFLAESDLFFQPHTYSEYTIVVCLEGEVTKAQFGETQVIGRGEAIIGNHGVKHTSGYWSREGKRCEAVVLSVERRVLETLVREFNLPDLTVATSPGFMGKAGNAVLHECARSISEELRRGLPGHQLVVETLATLSLIHI